MISTEMEMFVNIKIYSYPLLELFTPKRFTFYHVIIYKNIAPPPPLWPKIMWNSGFLSCSNHLEIQSNSFEIITVRLEFMSEFMKWQMI